MVTFEINFNKANLLQIGKKTNNKNKTKTRFYE